MLKALGLLFACAAVWALLVWFAQRPMLFPMPPASAADVTAIERAGGEPLWLELPFGRVESWLLPPNRGVQPMPLLIYAHGNGELIDFWAEHFVELRNAGLAVLLVEFPGYGRSAGSPSQDSIVATLLMAYDRAASDPRFDANNITLYGRSLGGAAVTQLAARRKVRALILESTFTKVADIARRYGVPKWLVRDPFDSLAVIKAFAQPILIFHGSHDTIVPVRHGRALAAANARATLHEFPCGHNDCKPQWDLVRTFLAQAGVVSEFDRRLP